MIAGQDFTCWHASPRSEQALPTPTPRTPPLSAANLPEKLTGSGWTKTKVSDISKRSSGESAPTADFLQAQQLQHVRGRCLCQDRVVSGMRLRIQLSSSMRLGNTNSTGFQGRLPPLPTLALLSSNYHLVT